METNSSKSDTNSNGGSEKKREGGREEGREDGESEMRVAEGAAVEGLIRLSQRLWREFEIPEDRAAETPPSKNLPSPVKAKPKSKSKKKRLQSEISEGRPTVENCLAKQRAIQSETPTNAASLDILKGTERRGDSRAGENYPAANRGLPPAPTEQKEQSSLLAKTAQESQYKSCLMHVEIARFIAASKVTLTFSPVGARRQQHAVHVECIGLINPSRSVG